MLDFSFPNSIFEWARIVLSLTSLKTKTHIETQIVGFAAIKYLSKVHIYTFINHN